jgi:hypothetical protein
LVPSTMAIRELRWLSRSSRFYRSEPASPSELDETGFKLFCDRSEEAIIPFLSSVGVALRVAETMWPITEAQSQLRLLSCYRYIML